MYVLNMLELVAVCFFLHIYDASAINGLPMAGKFEVTSHLMWLVKNGILHVKDKY